MANLPTEIELQVVTPERHVLQETVQSVEVPGKEGYLGILPGHAPLLTELGIGTLTYKTASSTRFLTVIQGYAEVLPDRVTALAEAAERPEEIDVERARKAKAAAEKELATQGISAEEADEARTALMRAELRLQVAARVGHVAAGGTKAAHA